MRIWLVAVFVALTWPVQATADLKSQIADCAALDQDTARLTCYDLVSGRAKQDGDWSEIAANVAKANDAKIARPLGESTDPKQAKRLEFVRKFVSDGYLTKITIPDGSHLPRAYVSRKWRLLKVDDKKLIASVTLAYYQSADAKAQTLILRDGYNGQDIGKFDKYGLELKTRR